MAWWVPAYDGYALAAVVTKQLKLKTALKHKYLVLQVAAEAPADVDCGLVAVVYDKLVRCACRFCFFFFFSIACVLSGKVGPRSQRAARLSVKTS